MKLVACFCGLALLFASSARAQVNQQNSLLLASSDPGMAAAASPAASAPFGSLPASEAIADCGSGRVGGIRAGRRLWRLPHL